VTGAETTRVGEVVSSVAVSPTVSAERELGLADASVELSKVVSTSACVSPANRHRAASSWLVPSPSNLLASSVTVRVKPSFPTIPKSTSCSTFVSLVSRLRAVASSWLVSSRSSSSASSTIVRVRPSCPAVPQSTPICRQPSMRASDPGCVGEEAANPLTCCTSRGSSHASGSKKSPLTGLRIAPMQQGPPTLQRPCPRLGESGSETLGSLRQQERQLLAARVMAPPRNEMRFGNRGVRARLRVRPFSFGVQA